MYNRGNKIFLPKRGDFLDIRRDVENFLREDGVGLNEFYQKSLPNDSVSCRLRIKSSLHLVGMPWFMETFNILGGKLPRTFYDGWEGTRRERGEVIEFLLPFSIAVGGERVALNLLRRASSIATETQKFVQLATPKGIAILDTRKTTPGLRVLEKYAVRQGGGLNHRFNQSDLWIIKDNHKNFFGGIEKAVAFFQKLYSFYTPIVVEIHSLDELERVLKLAQENTRIRHLMLDNFSPKQVREALALKTSTVTYEISGGVTVENIPDYLLEGVDGISIGSITSFPSPVDLSLSY